MARQVGHVDVHLMKIHKLLLGFTSSGTEHYNIPCIYLFIIFLSPTYALVYSLASPNRLLKIERHASTSDQYLLDYNQLIRKV
jgi:hypothetical protein